MLPCGRAGLLPRLLRLDGRRRGAARHRAARQCVSPGQVSSRERTQAIPSASVICGSPGAGRVLVQQHLDKGSGMVPFVTRPRFASGRLTSEISSGGGLAVGAAHNSGSGGSLAVCCPVAHGISTRFFAAFRGPGDISMPGSTGPASVSRHTLEYCAMHTEDRMCTVYDIGLRYTGMLGYPILSSNFLRSISNMRPSCSTCARSCPGVTSSMKQIAICKLQTAAPSLLSFHYLIITPGTHETIKL